MRKGEKKSTENKDQAKMRTGEEVEGWRFSAGSVPILPNNMYVLKTLELYKNLRRKAAMLSNLS